MKAKYILILVISVLIKLNQILAQNPVTIYTPKGSSVYTHDRPEYMDDEDKEAASEYVETYYPQATEINPHSATTTYNCHGYAWHISEGGSIVPIAYYYGDTDESIYWTDYSYIETTEAYASKISYTSDNHSAIQTSTQGIYRSKWGDYPLMQHARDYGPYNMSSRKYYRLYPGINGTETALCQNQERTFTSNTSISGSTYSWTRDDNLLDYVSGSGTTSYKVKAKSGDGDAWLRLQITTPSGEVATTNYKYVWVGKPLLYSVTGPDEGYVYNTYTFYANPQREPRSQAEYEWILNPLLGNDVRPYYDYTDISFYDAWEGYQVVARAYNTCGYSDWKLTNIDIFESEKMFVLSPNPASEEVTLTLKSPLNSVLKELSENNVITIYTIKILDFNGYLHFTGTRSGESFTIPVNYLKDGNYLVQISDGKKITTLKLVIKH